MMPRHLPRHRRRPLLFPVGVLALAGLLWLSGATLPRWGSVFYRQSVMQLTMLPRPTSDLIWPRTPEERAFLPRPVFVLRYSQLPAFRDWSTFKLGVSRRADSLTLRRMEAVVATIAAENSADNSTGLRVYFGPGTRYISLIATLSLMNQYGIKKYMLDIYHQTTTFYAFGGGPGPQRRHHGYHTWRPYAQTHFSVRQSARIATDTQLPPAVSWWTIKLRLDNWLAPPPTTLNELLATPAWQALLLLVLLMLAFLVYRIATTWASLRAGMQMRYAAFMARARLLKPGPHFRL